MHHFMQQQILATTNMDVIHGIHIIKPELYQHKNQLLHLILSLQL